MCTLDDIVEHCAAGPMVIPMFVPVLQQVSRELLLLAPLVRH